MLVTVEDQGAKAVYLISDAGDERKTGTKKQNMSIKTRAMHFWFMKTLLLEHKYTYFHFDCQVQQTRIWAGMVISLSFFSNFPKKHSVFTKVHNHYTFQEEYSLHQDAHIAFVLSKMSQKYSCLCFFFNWIRTILSRWTFMVKFLCGKSNALAEFIFFVVIFVTLSVDFPYYFCPEQVYCKVKSH